MTFGLTSLERDLPVVFRNSEGRLLQDSARAFFNHVSLREPYARNTTIPAVVLRKHSWVPLSDVVLFGDLADCESAEGVEAC